MDDQKSKLEYILELAKHRGVATSSVSDGQVFVFKRDFLLAHLSSNPDAETFIIFVKSEEAQDVSALQ